jgi:hypothetical protein
MPFNHDSTGVSPDAPMILLMPDGWYTFKIKEAEELKSKKGNDMILVKCKPVNDEQYEDVTIWHYVVFIPKGSPGEGISVNFRKSIGVAFGGNDLVDADDWVGRKFKAYVTSETYEGKTRNKISEVASLESTPEKDEEVPF